MDAPAIARKEVVVYRRVMRLVRGHLTQSALSAIDGGKEAAVRLVREWGQED